VGYSAIAPLDNNLMIDGPWMLVRPVENWDIYDHLEDISDEILNYPIELPIGEGEPETTITPTPPAPSSNVTTDEGSDTLAGGTDAPPSGDDSGADDDDDVVVTPTTTPTPCGVTVE